MNIIAKISCYRARCRYTEIVQRIFKFSDTHYISLTPDKELNSLVYRTLSYVNIYGSYKLSKKQSGFFDPTCTSYNGELCELRGLFCGMIFGIMEQWRVCTCHQDCTTLGLMPQQDDSYSNTSGISPATAH